MVNMQITAARIFYDGPRFGIKLELKGDGSEAELCSEKEFLDFPDMFGAYVRGILLAVGVTEWDDLKGSYVRVELGQLKEDAEIFHIIEPRPSFGPKKFWDEHRQYVARD